VGAARRMVGLISVKDVEWAGVQLQAHSVREGE
jgi:hypothetical protein